MKMLSTTHITLPSNTEEALIQFDPFLDRICDVYNINNSYYSTLKVSLTEAIKNAVEHGNHKNTFKYVQVDLEQSNGGLTFTVTDEGDGFDWENIHLEPDHTATGLYLIRALSDEMMWNNEGRSIKITFYVSSINYDHAVLRQNILQNYFKEIHPTATHANEQQRKNQNIRQ
ncbi:MAG: ATP-binding protein [Bacteroidales bacterium]|nr:ATP-binding protein [Bacteroidales bacterium]